LELREPLEDLGALRVGPADAVVGQAPLGERDRLVAAQAGDPEHQRRCRSGEALRQAFETLLHRGSPGHRHGPLSVGRILDELALLDRGGGVVGVGAEVGVVGRDRLGDRAVDLPAVLSPWQPADDLLQLVKRGRVARHCDRWPCGDTGGGGRA